MLCAEITGDIFMEKTKNHFNLCNRLDFITPHVRSIFTESVSYLGPKICDIFQKNLNIRNL